MLRYRSFRNTDPLAVTALWRSRAAQPWFYQPVSSDLLEQFVFAKLDFDYRGLILAFDGDRPVGFVHAGFGPNADRNGISVETGVICLVLVRPDCAQRETVLGLIDEAEQYLRQRGARVIQGGSHRPCNPFYTGLYGGVQPPGVLEADAVVQEAYRQRGYDEAQRTLIFRLDLAAFRAPMDRQQFQLRRQMMVQTVVDPPSRDRWEAATWGELDLTRFELTPRGGVQSVAHAVTRDMVLRDAPVGRAAGVLELEVQPAHRRQGMGTFLLAELFRTLSSQGVTTVEAHACADNPPSIPWCRKLGFQQVAQGTVFRKTVGYASA